MNMASPLDGEDEEPHTRPDYDDDVKGTAESDESDEESDDSSLRPGAVAVPGPGTEFESASLLPPDATAETEARLGTASYQDPGVLSDLVDDSGTPAVHAELAADPAEVIEEARRKWEQGIVHAESIVRSQPEEPPPPQQQESRNGRRRLLVVGIFVLVIVVVVAVTIALRSIKTNEESPSPTALPIWDRAERWDSFEDALSAVSDPFNLQQASTAQYRALNWLVDDPAVDLDPSNTTDLIQRYVITLLYFATTGGDGDPQSLLPGEEGAPRWSREHSDICNWGEEILCDNNDKVTEVNLKKESLRGTIPAELASLSDLSVLQFSENSLSGTIPAELASLSALTVLRLSENNLTGSIPKEFGSLTQLTKLTLDRNDLTGTIPSELAFVTDLHYLDLGFNRLIGSFPTELLQLTNIFTLWLCCNNVEALSLDPLFCDGSFEFSVFGLDCDANTDQCSCCTHCCNNMCDCEVETCFF